MQALCTHGALYTPCEPPPSSMIIRELGRSWWVRSAPWYGVAASSVPWSIMIGGRSAPVMRSAYGCGSGQNAQGMFIQALAQVSMGATLATAMLSLFHTDQLRGQRASLHSTAV